MKKRTKIILGIVIAFILLIVLPITYFVVRDLQEESKLDEIVNELSSMDLLNEEIDMTIYTKRDYGTVEKTIKTYLSDYATAAEKAISVMQDERFVNVLTIDNYETDGKDFKETKRYIEEVKKSLSTSFDTLIQMTETEEMMKRIEEKKLDDYYVDLYEEYMFDGDVKEELTQTKKQLEESRTQIENIINIYEETISLLSENQSSWYIQDHQLYISNTTVLNKYNHYISNLQ